MRRAAGRALLVSTAALLTLPPAVQAAAPLAQRAALEDGTAILQLRSAAQRGTAARSLAAEGLPAQALHALPLVVVRGTEAQLRAAARREDVVAAHPDRPLDLELYQATRLVFEDHQAALATLGYDGRGVGVAIVDTGIDALHPDLADHVLKSFQVVGSNDPQVTTTVVDCSANGTPCDTDTNGHGSHVAGIAVGDGTASQGFYPGIAPGANLVGYAVGVGPSILSAVTAYDHILSHPELGVRVVNSSFGPSGGARFDSTDPVNVATKALHDAGVTVVFSFGNSGKNTARSDPPGASDCSTQPKAGGGREATAGACVTNAYAVAPWVLGAAAGRKDLPGGPGKQHLSDFSARGDPTPQVALSGETIRYAPTLVAPGVNVRSIRDPTASDSTAVALTGDPSADAPPAGGEAYEPFYTPLSGTSMAAPAVTGAVAVVQSAARARLGRFLSPDEVRAVLRGSAVPIQGIDALWDYPCPTLVDCGVAEPSRGETGLPYADWQVGAGYLDVARAIAAVEAMVPPATPGGGTSAGGTVSGSGGDPAPGSSASDPSSSSPSDQPPPPPADGGVLNTLDTSACTDRSAPTAGAVRLNVARTVLRGTAVERGCSFGFASRARSIRVAIARVSGGRCRFLDAHGAEHRPRR